MLYAVNCPFHTINIILSMNLNIYTTLAKANQVLEWLEQANCYQREKIKAEAIV